jgi:phosphatidylserine/phosphatidylglycerophosphate/cardiolipin synthase-like enzyme
VANALSDLQASGFGPSQIAVLLDVLATDRARRKDEDIIIELVATGPDVPGLANRDTAVVVRELFQSAQESVIAAGYAVYQGRDVFDALARRMAELPELRVQMFLDIHRRHGDLTLGTELIRSFARRFREREWPGGRMPEIFYDPRSLEAEGTKRASLHAKCVVIDRREIFVSSANFTEAAQLRNIEVGLLVRSRLLAKQLATHFEVLVAHHVLERVSLG